MSWCFMFRRFLFQKLSNWHGRSQLVFFFVRAFLNPISPLRALVLIPIIIVAQITESVFNFSKAVKVVNQSGQEVCQPAFLAIIGPKLADGPPILEEKYKMPQIQIPNTTYKIRLYKFANQQWADRAPFWILFKMKKYKRLKNTDTNGKIQL